VTVPGISVPGSTAPPAVPVLANEGFRERSQWRADGVPALREPNLDSSSRNRPADQGQ
jgi:hypothetical protein